MSALYQLTADFMAVASKLEEMELDEQTIADTLEGYSAEFDDKVISIASFIRNLEATAEAIKKAEEAQAERRKSLEKKADFLRAYLISNMKAIGKTAIECPLFAVKIRQNPPSVQVIDDAIIPIHFMTIKSQTVLDKKKLKEALEAGEQIEGASLIRNNSISIK